MSSGVKDIQLLELKDTILQLNNTIREQSSLIENLQKLLEERNAADAKKDQIISNLEAQLEFLKQKLFGSTSESRKAQCPGQMSIFDLLDGEEEKPAVEIEPEIIAVKAYKKERKPKATYDEMFAGLLTTQIRVDTLTEEQKICSVCGTQMVPIGHEVIRTEIKYTEPKDDSCGGEGEQTNEREGVWTFILDSSIIGVYGDEGCWMKISLPAHPLLYFRVVVEW